MHPATLADWLDFQMRVHPRAIELGLARVAKVWKRLGAPPLAALVITVGGTNGKGSTVAFLDAMLVADGKRVGAFTSPHLLHYNERIRVAGGDIDDATLMDAFARIEAVRGEIALTYFEYATLAALWIFAHAALDVALLEVGLGGRLDAVNIIDADTAIVTTVDLDHQEWLGSDRESVGREKAGIFRAGRTAIVGETEPPRSLLAHAHEIGAKVRIAGRDFRYKPPRGSDSNRERTENAQRDIAHPTSTAPTWSWSSDGVELALPMPQLVAPCQLANAAAAIAALYALRTRLPWSPAAIARGVAAARIDARLQRFRIGMASNAAELIVDVAHNPQAARALADWLRQERTAGRTLAVFGALNDKDVRGIVAALEREIDHWFLAGLQHETPRGLTSIALRDALDAVQAASTHDDVAQALAAAVSSAGRGDRVLAFGSFFVAAATLRYIQQHGWTRA